MLAWVMVLKSDSVTRFIRIHLSCRTAFALRVCSDRSKQIFWWSLISKDSESNLAFRSSPDRGLTKTCPTYVSVVHFQTAAKFRPPSCRCRTLSDRSLKWDLYWYVVGQSSHAAQRHSSRLPFPDQQRWRRHLDSLGNFRLSLDFHARIFV